MENEVLDIYEVKLFQSVLVKDHRKSFIWNMQI